MTNAVERARDDLAAGRAWKARDRLTGALHHRRGDDEVLDLLAQAHHEMGDLPAAGALWFVTGRSDQPAEEAMAAWRERASNPEAQWSSLPRPLRIPPLRSHVAELGAAADRLEKARVLDQQAAWRAALDDEDPVTFGGVLLCALLVVIVVLTIIGGVTVVTWLVA